jgi:hypothetical protein
MLYFELSDKIQNTDFELMQIMEVVRCPSPNVISACHVRIRFIFNGKHVLL